MEAARPAAGAALGLAALLAAAPFAPRAGVAGPCEAAVELAAEDGRSTAVGCGSGAGAPLRGPARLLFGARLDPNRAAPRHLEALPGIGPARAAAIATERCRRPFASPADLVRVAGIGVRTVERLAPSLQVEPPLRARCPAVD